MGQGVRPGRLIPIGSYGFSYLIAIGLSQDGTRRQQGNADGNENHPDHLECFLVPGKQGCEAARSSTRQGRAPGRQHDDIRIWHVSEVPLGPSMSVHWEQPDLCRQLRPARTDEESRRHDLIERPLGG
jgi:hypothetical protein